MVGNLLVDISLTKRGNLEEVVVDVKVETILDVDSISVEKSLDLND